MQQINGNPKNTINEDLVRHIVLNSLRSYNKQFKSKYGKLVICCDSKRNWRRDYFPLYKSNRKKAREASPLDWNSIFETLNKIKEELKIHFPYRVVEVEGAEADDVIAVLTERYCDSEDILILSSDKDFVQLQKLDNVDQYSPILKRFIRTNDPELFIKEQIIRGDSGDGVPNFLSPDNTFVTGSRQKSISKKNLTEWIKQEPEEFCVNETMKRGYDRNKLMIDLSCIPLTIKNNIIERYDSLQPKNKTLLIDYFMKNKLKNLMEVVDEF